MSPQLKSFFLIVTSIVYGSSHRFSRLIILQNARCTELLSRRDNPEKGYRGCTHLLAVQPTGQKYKKAVEWGMDVVTVEWLVRCAFTGRRLPEKDYPVVEAEEDKLHKKVEELDAFVLAKLRECGCAGVSVGRPSQGESPPSTTLNVKMVVSRCSRVA
jgi:hypothetical protein